MSLNAKDGKKKAGEYHDAKGLYLKVEKSGAARWQYRYMLNGYPRKMGLGPVDAIGLAEARDKRAAARNLVKNGIDPIEARKEGRRAQQKTLDQQITLAQAREGWINSGRQLDWNKGTGSTADRHKWLWGLYGEYIKPKHPKKNPPQKTAPWLGQYQVIDLADGNLIVQAFTEIISKQRFKKSAKYALQQLRNIIDWAIDEKKLPITNPVNLKRDSKFLRRLPSLEYEVANRRPMPCQDVPAFVARLRAERGGKGKGTYSADERPLPAEVMELQILTGARPAQARLAQWEEFDLDNQTWKVPLHTTVNGRRYYRRKRSDPLELYINRQAVALLRAIKKRQEEQEGGLRKFVFSHGPALTASPGYHPTYAWIRKETSKYGDSDFRYGGMPITNSAVRD